MGVRATHRLLAMLVMASAVAMPARGQETRDEETPAAGKRHETQAHSDPWWEENQTVVAQGAATAPAETQPAAETGQPELETVPVNVPEDKSVPAAPDDPTVLDDVLVTSQKRVQSIQDVPISVSAMTGDFMVEQGLTDIREAMMLMANVKIEEAGFFAAPRIRGFTFNNNNKAFEPPVGIVIDSIPYTRPEYFMMAMFDAERLEVMRGPQGTTFGKNTTAGLVHLMTKDPTSSPEGSLQVQLGELNRKHVEAAYGGPLTENGIDFRVAGLYDERDGFIRNTTGDILPTVPKAYKDRKRTGARAKLGIADLFGSTLKLGVEQVSLLSGGAAFEYTRTTPDFLAAARRYDPQFEDTPGNWTASEDFPGFREVQITTYNGQWDYGLAGWDLVGVGGHSVMTQDLQLDVDFTAAPATIGFGSDRSPTSTFELRTTSPTLDGLFGLPSLFGWNLGSTELLVGGFYEKREILDSIFRFGIEDGPLLELVQGANGNTGTGGGDFGGLTTADALQDYEEVIQFFNQHAEAIGAFTHVKWQFLPQWAWELGLRYTTETKDADWNLIFTTPPPNTILGRLGFIPFTDQLQRSEDNFQPKVALGYELTEDIKLFAHWTRGFKGGGYNAFAYRNTEDNGTGHNIKDLQYEPEITTEKGFDIKTRLFGGAARVNLSLYDMTAKDFQVLIRNNPSGTIGLGTTQVQNAEGARAAGAELDVTVLVTDWFSVIGAVGFNETEYLKFTKNDCPSDAPTKPCDATGSRFPYAPLWNSALSLVSDLPFERIPLVGRLLGATGLNLFMGLTAEHQTWSFLDTDLDVRKKQPEFYRLKANVGFGNPARRWSFRVIGENLNNAQTWIRAGDIFAGQFAASQNEPRLVFAQFRQDF